MHGKVFPADDPVWKTWYPPNGWGCQCSVEALSAREAKALGKTKPDTPPEGTKGIDKGFEYAPGRSLTPAQAVEAMENAARRREDEWEIVSGGDWRSAGRPERVPHDVPRSPLAQTPKTKDEARAIAREVLGGEDRIFTVGRGAAAFPVRVNAEALVDHLPLDRFHWLPLLPELFDDPFEVWMGFERRRASPEAVEAIAARHLGPPRAELPHRQGREYRRAHPLRRCPRQRSGAVRDGHVLRDRGPRICQSTALGPIAAEASRWKVGPRSRVDRAGRPRAPSGSLPASRGLVFSI